MDSEKVVLDKTVYDGIVNLLNRRINGNKELFDFEKSMMEEFMKLSVSNAKPIKSGKRLCRNAKVCIAFNCTFEHSEDRPKPCECNKPKCNNLHRHQAICLTKGVHPCNMAHSVEELNKKIKDGKK